MLVAGDAAPDFSGTDIVGGGTFTLSAHAGQVVCLAMSAYWCPHCTNELTRLQNLWTKYAGHGVQMAAVHVDPNQAAAVTWLAGLGVTFPVVQNDVANTLFSSYATGTTGIPQLYIINRNQVIHSSHLGAELESVIEGYILDAIYVRDPVDIEMVMDASDSMNVAPSGGDTKLVMMKQASDMVVDFLRDHGQTADRMGLIWFSDNASEYVSSSGDRLLPVMSNWSDLKNRIDIHTTGTCTAMGAGLQMAFNALSASTNGKFAILLTDGMQNIEPKVTQVGSHFEIIDSDGWLCGGHSSTPAMPGVDIATYNTGIHTIGVGVAATYASLLQDVADATGGLYLGTNDPASDLGLIYFVDLCNCLAGGSPAIIHHHSGTFHPEECHRVETFLLNRSVRKITVILAWEETLAGSLMFWLRAPNGTLIELHQEMKLYDTYSMATIYLPKELNGRPVPYIGQWEMVIGGEIDGPAAKYQALVICEDARHKFRFDYSRKHYEVGDILPLQVILKGPQEFSRPTEIVLETATSRVPIAELVARYTPYDHMAGNCEKQPSFQSLETKLKAIGADKRLSAQILPIRQRSSLREGTLDCKIAEGVGILPIALTQPGLHTFRVSVLYQNEEQGPVSRTSMISVHVHSGKADPRTSNVNCVPTTRGKILSAILYVTPRNAAGHLLGPGLSDEIGVRVGRRALECRVADQLDGTYRVETEKVPAKERITLTFKDVTLWERNVV